MDDTGQIPADRAGQLKRLEVRTAQTYMLLAVPVQFARRLTWLATHERIRSPAVAFEGTSGAAKIRTAMTEN